jgi:UDP-2-acetamido-2,6-beta-L-arabino-hexul-4-ose reductase
VRAGCFERKGSLGVTRVLITGGNGFLGRNLACHLRERKCSNIAIFDRDDSIADLEDQLRKADIIFHLAGVNRPEDPSDFEKGNTGLTELICELLRKNRCLPKIAFSSSIQAQLDTPYGLSKLKAEAALRRLASETGISVRVYRLKNLFGKWCRPNYNSVTATFCHNIANGIPITISDTAHCLELSYVDDVVAAFIAEIDRTCDGFVEGMEIPSYRIQLGDLAGRIQAFHESRTTVTLPDFSDWFNRALYATYLSYVPLSSLEDALEIKSDARGSLAEFIKSKSFGQVFVSRTKPGITRGNHYHHTKAEKFLVVEGEGLIRMRTVEGSPLYEYRVSGEKYQIINIPPGVTHSITNVGASEMVTLFWASELFNPDRTDTYFLPVDSYA